MKSVIIIAIAFVLLIPVSVYALEANPKTINFSNSSSTELEIIGDLNNYQGNLRLILTITSPDNSEMDYDIRITGEGPFSKTFSITEDWDYGKYVVQAKYGEMDLGITSFVIEMPYDPRIPISNPTIEIPEESIEEVNSTIDDVEEIIEESISDEKPILDFVDTNKDPTHYIDRYHNEPGYKIWFDENYPNYTIFEAVGVDEFAYVKTQTVEDTNEQIPVEDTNEQIPVEDTNEQIPVELITRTYLPTSSEIGNDWRGPTNKHVYDEAETASSQLGYLESSRRGFMKGGGFDSQFFDGYIYRFDTNENAKSFYQNHVNSWERRGGYSQWDTSISKSDECYGRTTSGMWTDKVSLYCVGDTIVVFVFATGYEFEVKNDVKKFASVSFQKAFPSTGSDGGGCLIATATYGSELAPQVQKLREIRDNSLLQTESGTNFMNLFNDFYYSFSPIIADYERENPVFKEAVKITLTPLISSLSILNYVDMDSESSVLGYGISLILLNIGMYVGIPAIVIVGIKRKF